MGKVNRVKENRRREEDGLKITSRRCEIKGRQTIRNRNKSICVKEVYIGYAILLNNTEAMFL